MYDRVRNICHFCLYDPNFTFFREENPTLMKQVIHKQVVLAITLILTLLLAGCNQNIADSSKGNVTITLSGVTSTAQAKTLMPASLAAPETYKLTLQGVEKNTDENGTVTYTDLQNQYTVNTSGSHSSITIESVLIGLYRVTVEGFDHTQKTMEGTASGYLSVSPNGTNAATVAMKALSNAGTGSLEISFDWTEVAETNDSIKEAIAANSLKFELFVADSEGKYVSQGKKTADTGKTVETFTWTNLAATSGSGAYFKVLGNEDVVLCSNFLSTTLQVYAGQVSVPDANETRINGAFVLSAGYLANAKNVYDVTWTYDENDPAHSIVVSWKNQMSVKGKNLFASVNVTYSATNVSETTANVPLAEDASTASYTIKEMTAGNPYTVKLQAVLTSGKKSPVATFLTDAMSKTLVTGIDIDETNLKASLVYGETFTLSATVSPADATNKKYIWTVSETDVLHKDADTFTAYKPGVTTITATAADNATLSDTTQSISVKLAIPENVTATADTNDVLVAWNSVPFAESYLIQKKSGTNDYADLATVENAFSYQDTAIMANVAYQYRVIAKADRLKTESFDPMSEASTPTAPLTPVIPTVTITTPTLSNFAITLDTPEKMVILPTTEKLTVNLASSIDGATAYTWYVNETAIKSGTYANASFVDLTATTAGLLEDAIGGQNNLKLEATINGMKYSATTVFSVIDVLDTSVTATVPSGNLRLPTTQGTVQITSRVVPGNATRQDVTYSSSDETIATVDATGLVTIKNYGKATVTVTPAYGTASTLAFDFYTPTVTSHLAVLNATNALLKTYITAANSQFGGDWWPGISAATYSASGVTIKSPKGSGQSAGSFAIANLSATLDGIGQVALTTTTDIAMWAVSEGAAGYLSTDPLQIVGYDNKGVLVITLPCNQGTATIMYQSVNVHDARSGSYVITFDKTVGEDGYNPLDASKTLTDDVTVTRLF